MCPLSGLENLMAEMQHMELQAVGMSRVRNGDHIEMPNLVCKQLRCLKGSQTISRAELTAVLLTVMSTKETQTGRCVKVYTDSQYVCEVVKTIEGGLLEKRSHKLSNWDLVVRLQGR